MYTYYKKSKWIEVISHLDISYKLGFEFWSERYKKWNKERSLTIMKWVVKAGVAGMNLFCWNLCRWSMRIILMILIQTVNHQIHFKCRLTRTILERIIKKFESTEASKWMKLIGKILEWTLWLVSSWEYGH